MGTKYSTILVGGSVQTYNDNPPSDDGSQTEANRVKFATITSDLTAPLHSGITRMDAALVDHVDEGPTAKAGNFTTTTAEHNQVIECSGSITITLLAPSGNAGYKTTVKNAGTGTVTVDVSGGANIDGVSSISLKPDECRECRVNAAGSAYYTTTGILEGNIVQIIDSGSVLNQAQLDITDLSLDYRFYRLEFDGLVPATDAVDLYVRTSTDNGTSFEAGGTDYAWSTIGYDSGVSPNVNNDNTSSHMQCTNSAIALGTGTNERVAGHIDIHNPASPTGQTHINGQIGGISSDGNMGVTMFSGQRLNLEANDAIRILLSSGNISVMRYVFYGFRAS